METKNNNKRNKIRQILVLILLPFTLYLLPFTPTFAQSADQNYIITQTYTSPTAHNDVIRYYDGLGRPIETVQKQFTPNGKDLVTRLEYDNFGRESKAWLPVYNNNSNGAFDNTTGVSSAYGGDSYAYSETKYDPSPLNRINEQYGPGQDWRINSRSRKTEYLTNTAQPPLSCDHYETDGLLAFRKTGKYEPGTLFVQADTNEDNAITYTFTDKMGKLILEKKMTDASSGADTYYIYDDKDRLTFVLPPEASALFSATNISWTLWGTNPNEQKIFHLCYWYVYDDRNRVISKITPQKMEDYAYDKADRLVFRQTQNVEGSDVGRGWIFYKYDAFGRLIMTGIYHGDEGSGNNENVRAENMRNRFRDTVSKESRDDNNPYGYTWTTFPTNLNTITVTQINYYDNYPPFVTSSPLDYTPERDGYNDTRYPSAKGLPTAVRNFHLDGSGNETQTAYYYDVHGNIIQQRSTNHLGGMDFTYFNYGYNDQIIKKIIDHSTVNTTLQEEYEYEYDNALRLRNTIYRINGEPYSPSTDILTQYNYDETGRVETKQIADHEPVAYHYNLRSWLTEISGTYFSENLYYNDPGQITATKRYSGDLSALTWSSLPLPQGFSLTPNGSKAGPSCHNVTRGYSFAYDQTGRLLDATYGEETSLCSRIDRYTENFTYDKNGNITTLKRMGRRDDNTFEHIDNLILSYNGNLLDRVTEKRSTETSSLNASDLMHFPYRNISGGQYVYNGGRVVADYNRNISQIKYNCLGSPASVQFRYGHRIEYLYDAAGRKLQVKHKESASDQALYPWDETVPPESAFLFSSTTDYVNNKIYEDGNLAKILNDEGYVEINRRYGNRPLFFYKDHLGSIRIAVNAEGEVVQANNYYPSGTSMAEDPMMGVNIPLGTTNRLIIPGYPIPDYPIRTTDIGQPYKFSAKELDRSFDWAQYDFSARTYDPVLARFTTTDPLCEKYYSISPYAYCGNNPVNSVDLRGDSITVLNLSDGQHMALLIQNDAGKWQYFSVNGDNVYSSGKHTGGRKFDDLAIGEFDSPQQFLDSPYNSKVNSKGEDGKDDKDVNGYGFAEGYVIPTTAEQDNTIRTTFTDISKNEDYSLGLIEGKLPNQCATVTQRSLTSAGIKTTITLTTGTVRWGEDFRSTRTFQPYLPSQAYKVIKNNNSRGYSVYRPKK